MDQCSSARFGHRRGRWPRSSAVRFDRRCFAGVTATASKATGVGAGCREPMTIYDASLKYAAAGTPLIVLAGKEYGSGSSRDWAAKGPRLLGVRAVIAESFERIHRSNLVGMGILPLQFAAGQNAGSLGLTGYERYDVLGLSDMPKELTVSATADDGKVTGFRATVRIDTPQELQYYRHGGILEYVLRQLAR